MPSFPQPGEVTICEINRDLIVAEKLSDDRSKDTYGKILGTIFSPIPFQPNPPLSPEHEQRGNELKSKPSGSSKHAFFRNDLNIGTEVKTQGLSWHPHTLTLAFISGPNYVTVHDYGDSEGKDTVTLRSELQRDVMALEWRPKAGKVLAVACIGGICIWSASYPGNATSVRYGTLAARNTISGGSAVRWVLVDFLPSIENKKIERCSALSWSPDGIYLASASCDSSSFTIWDVAQGVPTQFRRGLGAISMLKWSQTGDYLLTAKFDGTFYFWETNTWTSELWSSTGGYVTGAAWDLDGRMVLIAFLESTTLGSIHFASRPSSLDAHLLPVELPEITSLTGSHGIENIAWDSSGERLAVTYKGGDKIYSGLIAVYDIRRMPLISASLVGFIRGPGENPKPLAFSFHGKFKQGPLLSVCWSSGWCCTYPLLFRSHMLP